MKDLCVNDVTSKSNQKQHDMMLYCSRYVTEHLILHVMQCGQGHE
jgi:hypothetical protein